MVTCSSFASAGPGSEVSSACSHRSLAAIPSRVAAGVILPGRRRLMREEDSPGPESEEEGEDDRSSPLPSDARSLRVSGGKRNGVEGELGDRSDECANEMEFLLLHVSAFLLCVPVG